mmetsp:Transcript_66464/g.160781  ORF Transcript_66464/g.160781 Transcript_66464/m.160781 type:complete len:279 (-) Transcript_66464:1285-2121(-)
MPGVPLQPRRPVLRGRELEHDPGLQDLHLRGGLQPPRSPVQGAVRVLDGGRLADRLHGSGRGGVRVRHHQGEPEVLQLVAEEHELLLHHRVHEHGHGRADQHHVPRRLRQDAQGGAELAAHELPGVQRRARAAGARELGAGALRGRRGARAARAAALLQLPAGGRLRRVPGALRARLARPRDARRAARLQRRRGRLPLHLRRAPQGALAARQGRGPRLRRRDPRHARLPGRQAGRAAGPGAPGGGAHEPHRLPAAAPRQLPQGEDGRAPGEVQRGDRG